MTRARGARRRRRSAARACRATSRRVRSDRRGGAPAAGAGRGGRRDEDFAEGAAPAVFGAEPRGALQGGDVKAEAKPETRPEPPKPVAAAPAAAAAPERAADALDFIWPAKGHVLAGFSEPRSKGVDIEGKLGDPVVAAAAGRVIYVGSGIPGLGKFIVVRHENGFNTVYAHNRENLVKMDQNLARGQKIAEIGNTDADTPKLHFQIRKLGTPLDPMQVPAAVLSSALRLDFLREVVDGRGVQHAAVVARQHVEIAQAEPVFGGRARRSPVRSAPPASPARRSVRVSTP